METVRSNEFVVVSVAGSAYALKATYQTKKVAMTTDKLEVLIKINKLCTNVSNFFY
jgi:hypothetical protein